MFCYFALQLFKEDPETGLMNMALSSDSTCVNHLYSAQDGYETLHMEKIEQPQQPQDIMVSSARCEFPQWMKGDWEGLQIGDNGQFTFRDEVNFKTYRGHCVTQMPNADQNLDGLEGQRYLLFLSTDCGKSSYSCALFKKRDTHVLEFQLGKKKTLLKIDRLLNLGGARLDSSLVVFFELWLTSNFPLITRHFLRLIITLYRVGIQFTL